jgi:hypothetical protein
MDADARSPAPVGLAMAYRTQSKVSSVDISKKVCGGRGADRENAAVPDVSTFAISPPRFCGVRPTKTFQRRLYPLQLQLPEVLSGFWKLFCTQKLITRNPLSFCPDRRRKRIFMTALS